jgi:oxygen-independent coproporphyrinogen-3 oxidase
MDALRAKFALAENAETTLEANPGTVSLRYLQKLRQIGFNRLSFGVQSAHPRDLHLLERTHDFYDVIRAVRWARQAEFKNLSLDLIFGLPEQPLSRWQETVKRALDLHPEHLSLYALTIEQGTPLGHWAARGLVPLPDPDLAADMYAWAREFLAANGFVHYEISNWAQPGRACLHNLQYWRNLPYFGAGAGAHGYIEKKRYANVLGIQAYLRRLHKPTVRFPAAVSRREITRDEAMQETMMLGLRLTEEGVSEDAFAMRFGAAMQDVFSREINELLSLGLLEWVEKENTRILRLTSHAYFLSNRVFRCFVD